MAQVDDALRKSLDRLVPVRREEPEWENVLERSVGQLRPQDALRRKRRPSIGWLMPAAAVVATLVAVTLVAVSPWSGAPSVVSKAEAAIAPAARGEVLYERADIRTKAGFGYRCVRYGTCKAPSVRIAVWVEGGTGTRRFRAIN